MFNIKKDTTPTPLRVVIDDLLAELDSHEPESDEYSKIVDQIVKLYKLQEVDSSQRVSANTWAMIGGNLAGIMLIINYERVHVVATKALGLVSKVR